MSDNLPRASRRSIFRRVAGLSAVLTGLFSRNWNDSSSVGLISAAQAQSYAGVRPAKGNILSVKGMEAITSQIAEWTDPAASTGDNRIAQSPAAVERAPAHAARYEAKLYNFPSGSLRTLKFKQGSPVFHQITFESHIYVLQGSATLRPLTGLSGNPVNVKAGDALYLPSGVLESAKAAEDFVILQAFVSNTAQKPKTAIMTAEAAQNSETAQWQADGKPFTARTPEELKTAPATAARWTTKRYVFDGNSIRVANFRKGGTSNVGTTERTDVLIYIAKGHFRRKEGDEMLDLVAGDVVREKMGNPGYWEALEDSVFIATDAPVTAANPGTGWAAAFNKTASEGTKLFEMSIDHNSRSTVGLLDIPMQKISDVESMSAKQAATYFRIGFRPFLPRARTNADYTSNGGPFEMHVGGPPHFVARMVGTTENTLQDGSVFRQSAGDFVYTRPGSLHHSNQVGYVPGVVMNVFMPGTNVDTQPLVIK